MGYSAKTAPNVPFLEKCRKNYVFEAILCKINGFWGKFSPILGAGKSSLRHPINAIGGEAVTPPPLNENFEFIKKTFYQ